MMTVRAGCSTIRSSESRPLTDTKGVDPAQHNRDVAECKTFAREISQEKSNANGAVAGAILGLIAGAAFGLRHGNLSPVVAAAADDLNFTNS
jgi:hypothetical protein